jgi:endonuclease/exonuclease/phosphatase family metal-dependent hydrolase
MLRIATFNLETLHTPGKHEAVASLKERFAILRTQLARLSADILCLQEVDGERASPKAERGFRLIEALVEGTAYQGFQLAGTHAPGGAGALDKHNLVILSRFPLERIDQYANDLVPPPRVPSAVKREAVHEVRWDRPVLHARAKLPSGRLLHIINVHFKAPLASHIEGEKLAAFVWSSIPAWAEGFFLSALKRTGQALETRLIVERIFDAEEAPLIAVCGDFNAEAAEMPVRLITAGEDDTGNGRLAHRALVPLDRALPLSLRYSAVHHGRRQMVDRILASRFLLAALKGVEAHNESLGDELVGPLTVERAPVSYHAPFVAEFALDGAAPAGA